MIYCLYNIQVINLYYTVEVSLRDNQSVHKIVSDEVKWFTVSCNNNEMSFNLFEYIFCSAFCLFLETVNSTCHSNDMLEIYSPVLAQKQQMIGHQ